MSKSVARRRSVLLSRPERHHYSSPDEVATGTRSQSCFARHPLPVGLQRQPIEAECERVVTVEFSEYVFFFSGTGHGYSECNVLQSCFHRNIIFKVSKSNFSFTSQVESTVTASGCCESFRDSFAAVEICAEFPSTCNQLDLEDVKAIFFARSC